MPCTSTVTSHGGVVLLFALYVSVSSTRVSPAFTDVFILTHRRTKRGYVGLSAKQTQMNLPGELFKHNFSQN